MFKRVLLAVCLCLVVPSVAWADPVSDDPGWWEATFVGVDGNADGKYTGEERGLLMVCFDALKFVMGVVGAALLLAILNVIPSGWQVGGTGFTEWILAANAWVPMDFGMTLALYYYAFVGVFVAIKFVLKLIPGIG